MNNDKVISVFGSLRSSNLTETLSTEWLRPFQYLHLSKHYFLHSHINIISFGAKHEHVLDLLSISFVRTLNKEMWSAFLIIKYKTYRKLNLSQSTSKELTINDRKHVTASGKAVKCYAFALDVDALQFTLSRVENFPSNWLFFSRFWIHRCEYLF